MPLLTRNRRRALAGALAGPLLVALTACSSDDGGSGDGGSSTVTAASAQWSVRDSFVSYMTGSGSVTPGEGLTRDPDFTWPGGSGTYDAATGTGEIQLGGAVTFAMPSHCMNELTFRNPVVVIDGPSAGRLLADTTTDFFNQDTGEGIDCLADPSKALVDTFPRAHLVDLAISAVTPQESGGSTTYTVTATARLSADASRFFNETYTEGYEMAPLTLTFTTD